MREGITVTIGLDLGDRRSQFGVVAQESGEILEEGEVATTPRALGDFFARWSGSRVVIEVGPHSPWVSRLARKAVREVLVANPRKLKFIFGNRRKCDQVDARALARVGRLDPELLSPVEHRGESAQRDLAALRARSALVAARTKLVNCVRGTVKAFGLRLPKQAAKAMGLKQLEALPEDLRPVLEPLFGALEDLTARIKTYDKSLEALAEASYPATRTMTQVDGVGSLTALAYLLTVDDPSRLRRSRDAGPFFGLVPARDQSGETDRQLGITKTGDRLVRTLLVQCAHRILGPLGQDSVLRRVGLRLAARGGKSAKKRAVIAVARKLAVLLHRLWVTGEVYEPLRGVRAADVQGVTQTT
jgi:transposase